MMIINYIKLNLMKEKFKNFNKNKHIDFFEDVINNKKFKKAKILIKLIQDLYINKKF